jgi:outer membrane protein assembly factor BamD (BamD/ComL family)
MTLAQGMHALDGIETQAAKKIADEIAGVSRGDAMSVAGILSTNFVQATQNFKVYQQEFQQEFQQLGQDLQSGNLSAAQSDFAALQQLQPGSTNSTSTSTTQSNNPIQQALNQLGQDLQSGNTSAAEQDYTTLQQDLENASQSAGHAHHHHMHRSDSDSNSSQVSQLFSQLGQDLQSGNVSAAQQAYNSLLQDLPQLGQSSTQNTQFDANTAAPIPATNVSFTA